MLYLKFIIHLSFKLMMFIHLEHWNCWCPIILWLMLNNGKYYEYSKRYNRSTSLSSRPFYSVWVAAIHDVQAFFLDVYLWVTHANKTSHNRQSVSVKRTVVFSSNDVFIFKVKLTFVYDRDNSPSKGLKCKLCCWWSSCTKCKF